MSNTTTTTTTNTQTTAPGGGVPKANIGKRNGGPAEKPVAKIRMGVVAAAIWRNLDQEGRAWYSVTLERSYRDKSDDWQHTNSFGRNELLTVAKVANIAHSRVHEFESRDKAAAAYDEAAYVDRLTGRATA